MKIQNCLLIAYPGRKGLRIIKADKEAWDNRVNFFGRKMRGLIPMLCKI